MRFESLSATCGFSESAPMTAEPVSQIMELLRDARQGSREAEERLARALYSELRPLAATLLRRMFGRDPADGTNTPTAIVDAAWMRLIKQRQQFDDRRHFFAIASLQLRRVVIDYWREWRARGGATERLHTDFGELSTGSSANGTECEELFQAVERLERLDPVEADVVRLRFLWDLTIAETATALGISHATVERRWKHAQAWLGRELAGENA